MRWRWIAALGAILALTILLADYTSQPQRNLRRFDAHAVGCVETDMWVSYYEHRRLDLFVQMAGLMRDQYHLSRSQSLITAYHAARAAVVFQRGSKRTEYEAALPHLVSFYQWVLGPARDSHRPARLELEWWIIHRERAQYGHEALVHTLAELQAEIYRLPPDRFSEHARLRAEAMRIRDDRAAAGGVSGEEWGRIRALLDQSWMRLHAVVGMSVETPAGH